MTKSNEKRDDDFWEEGYEPSEEARKAIEQSYNEITRVASLSHDGEQFFVRIPKEVEEIMGLDREKNYQVKFTAREYPEKENEFDIELVRTEE